jgi:hypothetical protein
LILPALLAVFAALPAFGGSAEDIAGRWYSDAVENGVYAQLIEDRRQDGTFAVEIRARLTCEMAREWRETGSWTYADGILSKWTRTVGDHPVADEERYHDSFAVTPVDGDHMRLFDQKTEITWAATRVAPDFRFPPPGRCQQS